MVSFSLEADQKIIQAPEFIHGELQIWYFYSPRHKIYLRLHQGKEESWKLIGRHQVPFAIRAISEKKNSVDELERDRLGS
jgi:hypothetical protein